MGVYRIPQRLYYCIPVGARFWGEKRCFASRARAEESERDQSEGRRCDQRRLICWSCWTFESRKSSTRTVAKKLLSGPPPTCGLTFAAPGTLAGAPTSQGGVISTRDIMCTPSGVSCVLAMVVFRCECSAADVMTLYRPGAAAHPKVSLRSATSRSPIT